MSNFSDEERLNNIIEVISGMASLDFSKSVLIDHSDSPFNTIAMGLNMLGEELESNVVAKSELENKNYELERLAEQQKNAMLAMSTPITQLWENILLLPLVGVMDSNRAQDVLIAVLNKIADTQSTVFILDISGVAVVDTSVANHLIKIAKATRLMGCMCMLSGISPAIAQTIVELGIQVDEITTTGTMRDALDKAFQLTGVKLVEDDRRKK